MPAPLEPPPAGEPPASELRASDADREAVASALRAHCSAGRLTLDELSDRLAAVYRARTRQDLLATTGDLPALDPHPLPGTGGEPPGHMRTRRLARWRRRSPRR